MVKPTRDPDVRARWLDVVGRTGSRRIRPPCGTGAVDSDWLVTWPTGRPEHLLYLVVDGSGSGTIARRRLQLRPGVLVWIAPHTRTVLRTAPGQSMRLSRIRLAGGPSSWHDDVEVLDDANALGPLFDAVIAEYDGGLAGRERHLGALLVVLFSSLFRLADRSRPQAPLSPAQRTRIERYVDQRPAERPTVADLAELVGLSEDYFARRFRHTVGNAPKSWLVHRRVHAAALRLQESDVPVNAVAAEFGYPDLYLFSRQFKSVMGCSPRAWRDR